MPRCFCCCMRSLGAAWLLGLCAYLWLQMSCHGNTPPVANHGIYCLEADPTQAQVIGAISGSGRVVVKDPGAPEDAAPAVDLDLELVLGDMPRKTYTFDRRASLSVKQAKHQRHGS